MKKFDTIVVGGGAAGIVAAISAARRGRTVAICEKMPGLGRKILASGNGRCNLLNEKLDESFYNAAARGLVKGVFSKFGKKDIERFFEGLGLKLYRDETGRIFPATNQSASVLRALELELERQKAHIEFGFDVTSLSVSGNGFVVKAKNGKEIVSDSVVMACGGKSYPAFGSDGTAYRFARQFGHSVIEPVPYCVGLTVKDILCHLLQGQKISARVSAFSDGNLISEASGELLFTKYGLSGTAVLDLGEEVSVAMNRRRRNVRLEVDMVPFIEKAALERELGARIAKDMKNEDLLVGILPNKFGNALRDILKQRHAAGAAALLKARRFDVIGTRGWNEAEFTAGGVSVDEVSGATLESKLRKGLFFAGEMLDVNGQRGGYNLAWAWSSGFVAGFGA